MSSIESGSYLANAKRRHLEEARVFLEGNGYQVTTKPEKAPHIEVVKSPIDQIRESWQTERHTPELMTRISSRIWEEASQYIVVPFTHPNALKASQKDIETIEKEGDMVLYQPAELATPEGRPHLAQAFRMLGNLFVPEHWSTQKGNNVLNINLHAGWRRISGQVGAPNLDTSANKAKKTLFKDGIEGIDENELLSLGLFMKITQDVYPDQNGTWTWVLNSSQNGEPVNAGFYRLGDVGVNSFLNADDHDSLLGVRRSSGV